MGSFLLLAREHQVEGDGDECGYGDRGSTKDGADPCWEACAGKRAGRMLDTRTKGDGQPHERSVALG